MDYRRTPIENRAAAHARRARQESNDAPPPQHRAAFDWAALGVLFVFIAFLAVVVLWQRGYIGTPATPDYSADTPAQVAPAAPAVQPAYVPAPLPTIQPAQAEIIGAQAPHAIRGAEPTPAPAIAAPVEVAPVDLPPAAPVPTIAPAQAEIIGARTSNGCAAGEVFYPRSGCHATGSGGAMPGPVGAP